MLVVATFESWRLPRQPLRLRRAIRMNRSARHSPSGGCWPSRDHVPDRGPFHDGSDAGERSPLNVTRSESSPRWLRCPRNHFLNLFPFILYREDPVSAVRSAGRVPAGPDPALESWLTRMAVTTHRHHRSLSFRARLRAVTKRVCLLTGPATPGPTIRWLPTLHRIQGRINEAFWST